MSLNKAMLIGNLGGDPELRALPNGDTVVNVTIATGEKWKDKTTGEVREKTEWHRVVFFRKTADLVNQYCKKGDKLYIEGKIQTRKWQADDGSDRYTTEIVGDKIDFLTPKGQSGQNPYQNNQQNNRGHGSENPTTHYNAQPNYGNVPNSNPAPRNPNGDVFDDDIPF